MIRWGLCCIFREAPIKFRRTTAKYSAKLSIDERMRHLSAICLHNAYSLLAALKFCRRSGIGDFRINSQILPLKTHPKLAYAVENLPQSTEIINAFQNAEDFPQCWLNLDITAEVEAKAKEVAVFKLMGEIEKKI